MGDKNDGNQEPQHSPPAAGVDPLRPPQGQPEEPANHQRGPEKKRRDYSHIQVFGFPLLDALQATFDGILMVVGVLGAIVIYRQLQLMDRQMQDAGNDALRQQINTKVTLRLMAQQAQASTDAAKAMLDAANQNRRAADAAEGGSAETARIAKSSERSIEATRAALRLEQRAWVGIDRIQRGELVVNKPFTVEIVFTNTGKTPALDTIGQSSTQFMLKGQEPDFRENAVGDLRSHALVLPGQVYTVTNTFEDVQGTPLLENATIALIQKGEATIFLWGRINYSDIFGCQHWTNYCYIYTPKNGGYSAYSKGNTVDDSSCRKATSP